MARPSSILKRCARLFFSFCWHSICCLQLRCVPGGGWPGGLRAVWLLRQGQDVDHHGLLDGRAGCSQRVAGGPRRHGVAGRAPGHAAERRVRRRVRLALLAGAARPGEALPCGERPASLTSLLYAAVRCCALVAELRALVARADSRVCVCRGTQVLLGAMCAGSLHTTYSLLRGGKGKEGKEGKEKPAEAKSS